MKPKKMIQQTGQVSAPINILAIGDRKSVFRDMIVICITAIMITLPTTGVWADGGFMAIQYEFSLNKKLKFRQLNLAYKNNSGFTENQSSYSGETIGTSINIPLFSMGDRPPGLFNLLLNDERQLTAFGIESSESNGSSKPSAGNVLLFIGVLGIVAYSINEDLKDGCSGTEIAISVLAPGGNTDWCRDQ